MPSDKNARQGAYPRPARRNPLADCPLTAAFAAVGGKWKLTILYWLSPNAEHSVERYSWPLLSLQPGPVVMLEFARMEYDENGTPPRMYDRQGRLVRLPGAADRLRLHTPAALAPGFPVLESLSHRVPPPPPPLTGSAWIDDVMVPREKRDVRRANIERQLGRPSGQVRGLDRFVVRLGDNTHEVLVDPQAAVPVEVNTTRGADLVARTTLVLDRDSGGRLTGRRIRSERAVSGDSSERRVTEVELTNIQLTKEGTR